MSDWKPGDVAIAKYSHDDEPKIYMRVRNKYSGADERWESVDGSHSLDFRSADWWHLLAVIDPESDEDMERLAKAVVEAAFKHGNLPVSDNGIHWTTIALALREFAKPTPPKPERPTGLGAVVRDSTDVEFVHLGSDLWTYGTTDGPASSFTWDELDAVEVLSQGWSA